MEKIICCATVTALPSGKSAKIRIRLSWKASSEEESLDKKSGEMQKFGSPALLLGATRYTEDSYVRATLLSIGAEADDVVEGFDFSSIGSFEVGIRVERRGRYQCQRSEGYPMPTGLFAIEIRLHDAGKPCASSRIALREGKWL
jgi:hypothetical protein